MNDTAQPEHRFELEIRSSGATNTGLTRDLNEDALIAEYPLYLVADGMGGHEAGDRASAAVIDLFRPLTGRDDVDVSDVLRLAQEGHDAVLRGAGSENAGSTLTGVIAVHASGMRQWLVLNIGDSRVYRMSDGRLEQLTSDHSLVQELIDSGQIGEDDARNFPGRNIITRAFGDGESVPDVRLIPITPGERILVCSDGLTVEVPDTEIATGLNTHADAGDAATWLIDRAIEGGGRDNISVIVIDVFQEHANGDTFETVVHEDPPHGAFEETLDARTAPSERRRPGG